MSSLMLKIKKSFSGNEWLRIFLLIFFVAYAYYPFMSTVNLGNTDARWYQYLLHDAIIQFHHGIFPTFVGQSEFNFFGSTDLRAPYYLLFGITLHILTLGLFSSLFVQHLIVITTAFIAGFLTYYLLGKLAPQSRWWALLLAIFYVTCPGIIGLIYLTDSYHAFTCIPFVPFVIYGLARNQLKNDFLSCLIIAAGLSLIWMCHPPIALWTTAIVFFFFVSQLLFLKKGLKSILIFLLLFSLLSFFQFSSVFLLNLSDCAGRDYNFINEVIQTSLADMPAVFLPLGWRDTSVTPFLQLGYSLWFIIFMSFAISATSENRFLLRTFQASVILLFLFLYPLPWISHILWSLVPIFAQEITTVFVTQRLYVIVAALICFIGIMTLQSVFSVTKNSLNKILSVIFVLLFFWNIYEVNYFIKIFQARKTDSASWMQSENTSFIHYTLAPIFRDSPEDFTIQPFLKNRLLDQNQNNIPEYDAELVLANQCLNNPISNYDKVEFTKPNQKLPIQFLSNQQNNTFLKLKLQPKTQYFLCLNTHLEDTHLEDTHHSPDSPVILSFEIIGKDHYGMVNTSQTQPNSRLSSIHTIKNTQIVGLPIFITHSDKQGVIVQPFNMRNVKKLNLTGYELVNYDPMSLPIRIKSFTPFRAAVKTTTNQTYLEVFKQYLPGYKATVNGIEVPVLESQNLLVMIPLKEKGINQVELTYAGTAFMRLALSISGIAWSVLIIYLLVLSYRKFEQN